MDFNQVWLLIIGSSFGSGFLTFLIQKHFEHRFNKKLYRFNKLYSDKLDIIKNLYKLLIKAEKGLDILLSQREPNDFKGKEDFYNETMKSMDSFIDYFEENEIIFDRSIVYHINQIISRFEEAKQAHVYANLLESDRSSNSWSEANMEKYKLHDQLVKKEIPYLKQKLKVEFQSKYQLLEE